MTNNQKLIQAINGFLDIQNRYEAHLSYMVGLAQAWGTKNPDQDIENNKAFRADIQKLMGSGKNAIICLAGKIVATANQQESFNPYSVLSVEMKKTHGKLSVLFHSYGEMSNIGTAEKPHLELEINSIEINL